MSLVSCSRGSATVWAIRLGIFGPGEKFNFEPGTRLGFEIQPLRKELYQNFFLLGKLIYEIFFLTIDD